MMYSELKGVASHWLFRSMGVRRIHIIGCSRSGTTMMHLAMSHFANVVLAPEESSISYPGLSLRMKMVGTGQVGRGCHYVTKRDYDWFRSDNVNDLVRRAVKEKIGIIHIIRDPRDVLTSRHAQDESSEYVDEHHWSRSISAAQSIFDSLDDYSRKLELRYEDIVRNPEVVENKIMAAFGLEIRDAKSSIRSIARNLDKSRSKLHPSLDLAVHGIRDMDENSVARWKKGKGDALERVQSLGIRNEIEAFIRRNGYELQ